MKRSLPLVFAVAMAMALLIPIAAFAAQGTPTPNEVNAVAKELWCPLCNGVRLDNCELKACEQMREEIAQKLTAGESKEQIKAYFVTRYGDVVLGAPEVRGFNSIVWLLPVLAALVAVGWLVYFVRSATRRGLPAAAREPVAKGPNSPTDYEARVDEELSNYQ